MQQGGVALCGSHVSSCCFCTPFPGQVFLLSVKDPGPLEKLGRENTRHRQIMSHSLLSFLIIIVDNLPVHFQSRQG